MSYQVQIDEPLGEAARRAAREQARKGLEELHREDEPVSWRVHQVRKRCKKIRAVARLIRPDFDDYKDCNRYFRDLARNISDERDARVMYELVQEITGDESDEIEDATSEPLVRWHRLRSELADTAAERQMPRLKQSMARGAVGIEYWDLEAIDARSVSNGLHKTLNRAHRAHADLKSDQSAERFHELRKRCKYHWYHLRLLKSLLPPDLQARESVFEHIGDLLGDAHDGSMFLEHGEALPDFVGEQASSRWVFARVLEHRRQLRDEALKLCETALELSPDALQWRLDDYWHAESATKGNITFVAFRRGG